MSEVLTVFEFSNIGNVNKTVEFLNDIREENKGEAGKGMTFYGLQNKRT